MELVTASQVSQNTGLSPATIALYAKQGKFPTHEDSSGRRRFILSEIQEVIDRDGIKPRPRRNTKPEDVTEDETQAAVSQEEEEAPESDALPPQAVSIIAEALRRSKAAFRKSVQEQLAAKQADEEDPLEQESELVLLRIYMRAPEIFDSMRSVFGEPESE